MSQASDLISAVKAKDIKELKALLSQGFDPNACDDWHHHALETAASRGQLQALQILLDAGADPNLPAERGQTALGRACFSGHQKAVELLIAAGASVNHQDDFGCSALFNAVSGGHLALVEVLLEAGAEPNIGDADEGRTPIQRAVQFKYYPDSLAIFQALVKAGSNLQTQNANRLTLLMEAAAGGHLELTQHCLELGLSVNAVTLRDETALVLACRRKGTELALVQALVEAGAWLEVEDQWGKELLSLCAQNNNLSVLRYLLEQGLDPNGFAQADQGPRREPPVFWAVQAGAQDCLAYLLEAGADANQKRGRALEEALAHRKNDLAWRLLEAGAEASQVQGSDSLLAIALGCWDGYLYERSRPQRPDEALLLKLLESGAPFRYQESESILKLIDKWRFPRLRKAVKPRIKALKKAYEQEQILRQSAIELAHMAVSAYQAQIEAGDNRF